MLKKIVPILIGKYLEVKKVLFPKKAIEQGFNIFCTPLKGKAKPKHQEFFGTGIEEKHNILNHSIATYHWKGKAATIMLLHGWESNSFRWKSLIERLQAQDYNIIAVDAPAQGNSSGKYLNVPLYTQCVGELAAMYRPSVLVGHSLGGMTAIYYQHKNADSGIEKIIALGPPSELSLFMKGFQNTLGLSKTFMKKLDAYLHERFGFYAREFSIADFAKDIKIPGLLILDKGDELAPYKLSKKIASNWEACKLHSVEGIGHSLQSKDIDDLIVNFLQDENKHKSVVQTPSNVLK